MKFGKSLSNQIEETLPEWKDKFLSYKDLKKRLKSIKTPPPPPPLPVSNGDTTAAEAVERPPAKRARLSPNEITPEEADFISLLEAELDKFNTFFVEKEEEYVIRQKELQDRITAAGTKQDLLLKEIVDFHGEMVLLENYSALNYTGLVKILKKYDKRTGALLRLPFIRNVLQQPFFSTELLYKLVKECESLLDRLLPTAHQTIPEREHVATATSSTSSFPVSIPDLEEIKHMESMYMKSTVSALRVLKDIRKGSSTVSVFSLPPLQQHPHAHTSTTTSSPGGSSGGVEDRWGVTPVLEQVAK